jgi:hypothetical protein
LNAVRELRRAAHRALLALCLLSAALLPPVVRAHDLITAEAVEKYLTRADAGLTTVRGKSPPRVRAEAHYDLGRMLDEIRELLNRDVAMHGRVQGLPTHLLMKELKGRGLELVASPASNRFPVPAAHYAEALKLDADAHGGDAAFRLLTGRFYDSFDADPSRSRLAWPDLEEQMRLAERLAARKPSHPEQEEIEFVLAVQHVQAAALVPDRARAPDHLKRAQTAAAAFSRRYPDSLRNAALEVLTAAARP